MRHLPNNIYTMQDIIFPHKPGADTIDGEYGTYGIVRFYPPKTKYNSGLDHGTVRH